MRSVINRSEGLVGGKMIKKALVTVLVGLSALSFGCGGGTNNDQGVSFALQGFRADSANCVGGGSTGASFVLSSNDEAAGSSNFVIAGAILSNGLTSQFIRTELAFVDFFIPGADVQPPSTADALTVFLQPAAAATDTGASVRTEGCGEFFVVGPEIVQWLNFNRASIPEPPFTMEAIVTVTGISSAGDRFTTNQAAYSVTVLPDNIIPPTLPEGDEGDTGAGTVDEAEGTGTDVDVVEEEPVL